MQQGEMMWSRLFSVYVFLAVLMFFGTAEAKEAQLEFKVVPNRPGKIEIPLDTPPIESSTCRFEWDSSGATVEVR